VAVVRATIGQGQDFEDETLFKGLIPMDNLVPYVATYVDDAGKRRTPGIWLGIIADDTFAGGRHDVGTIISTQEGIEEKRPDSKRGAIYRRVFVVQGLPIDLRPKLHKLPLATDDILSKTGVFVNATETVKGKTELQSRGLL